LEADSEPNGLNAATLAMRSHPRR